MKDMNLYFDETERELVILINSNITLNAIFSEIVPHRFLLL